MAFCANCGHEVLATAAVCPDCGHPTGAATAPVGTLQYADFWSRFAALLIDAVILFIPSLVFGGGRYFGGLLITFLYHWLMVAYWNGQTIGKRALNIRVARPDGSPVDVAVAAARSGMRIVSGIPIGLGFLWAAWDPEKRTWHDMVAGTRAFRV
jgi:uncharacterized RDD family membrane protein YckC